MGKEKFSNVSVTYMYCSQCIGRSAQSGFKIHDVGGSLKFQMYSFFMFKSDKVWPILQLFSREDQILLVWWSPSSWIFDFTFSIVFNACTWEGNWKERQVIVFLVEVFTKIYIPPLNTTTKSMVWQGTTIGLVESLPCLGFSLDFHLYILNCVWHFHFQGNRLPS